MEEERIRQSEDMGGGISGCIRNLGKDNCRFETSASLGGLNSRLAAAAAKFILARLSRVRGVVPDEKEKYAGLYNSQFWQLMDYIRSQRVGKPWDEASNPVRGIAAEGFFLLLLESCDLAPQVSSLEGDLKGYDVAVGTGLHFDISSSTREWPLRSKLGNGYPVFVVPLVETYRHREQLFSPVSFLTRDDVLNGRLGKGLLALDDARSWLRNLIVYNQSLFQSLGANSGQNTRQTGALGELFSLFNQGPQRVLAYTAVT